MIIVKYQVFSQMDL